MKLALTTLYVTDMEKSLVFYHEILGLPIIRRQTTGPGKELVFLGNEDEAHLELIPLEEAVAYSGFSIGFSVGHLAHTRKKLAQHGYAIQREMAPNDTTTLCFLEGPNGEEVELIEYR